MNGSICIKSLQHEYQNTTAHFSPFPLSWLLVTICNLHWASAVYLDNLCNRALNVSTVTEHPRLSANSTSAASALPSSCPTPQTPSKPSFTSRRIPSITLKSTRNPRHPDVRWPSSGFIWSKSLLWISSLNSSNFPPSFSALKMLSALLILIALFGFVFSVFVSGWVSVAVLIWSDCGLKSESERKRREKMFSKSSKRNNAGTASRYSWHSDR